MCTYKSTYIASFVAKLAYIHVACNTYIPKVYIRLPAVDCIGVISRQARPAESSQNSGIKIHEIQFSEIKFMNKKAGIASHER